MSNKSSQLGPNKQESPAEACFPEGWGSDAAPATKEVGRDL